MSENLMDKSAPIRSEIFDDVWDLGERKDKNNLKLNQDLPKQLDQNLPKQLDQNLPKQLDKTIGQNWDMMMDSVIQIHEPSRNKIKNPPTEQLAKHSETNKLETEQSLKNNKDIKCKKNDPVNKTVLKTVLKTVPPKPILGRSKNSKKNGTLSDYLDEYEDEDY
jgi:hypothetical protein